MKKTVVKNYTQSELFKRANQIRKEKKVSQKEAYAIAKAEFETPKVEKKVMSENRGGRIQITEILKPKMTEKYNIKAGEVYPSIAALASHMGVTVQNLYGYLKNGTLKKID